MQEAHQLTLVDFFFVLSLQNQLARQNVQSFSNHTNTTSMTLGFLPDAKPHQSEFPPFWWGFL